MQTVLEWMLDKLMAGTAVARIQSAPERTIQNLDVQRSRFLVEL